MDSAANSEMAVEYDKGAEVIKIRKEGSLELYADMDLAEMLSEVRAKREAQVKEEKIDTE